MCSLADIPKVFPLLQVSDGPGGDMPVHTTAKRKTLALLEPYDPNGKRGRPPRGEETMLRMYLLANWFNLSDEDQ